MGQSRLQPFKGGPLYAKDLPLYSAVYHIVRCTVCLQQIRWYGFWSFGQEHSLHLQVQRGIGVLWLVEEAEYHKADREAPTDKSRQDTDGYVCRAASRRL